MKTFFKSILVGASMVLGLTMIAPQADANDFAPQIQAVFDEQVKPWLSDPAVINAIKAQNEKNAGVTEADIDSLDKQWRAEAKAGSGPLVDGTLGNELSAFLKGKKDAGGGIFSEIFVMDNKGLNVGQSDVTSDYMQGDEAKWQKTYSVGPDAVFIDEVEFDDSTESFQSQISATISDGGAAIGAITLGINVEELP